MTSEAELRAWMLASLKGDSAAHRALLTALSDRLRAYFRGKISRLGRSVTESEDLVQEALLAIHTRRHTYDPSQPLMPWVYAIARYKLIDHLRQTRASLADVPIDGADDVLAHDDHGDAESSHDIHKLLDQLPQKMRRAIEAVKLDGLTVAETAKRYGLSESDVKVSVHRGLKAITASIARERNS
jgi:RNA polymerase sigma-70 factor (ECF subfamily)